MRLHPVISARDPRLVGRAGVQDGRRLGRRCLERSARLVGAPHPPPTSGDSPEPDRLPEFPRDSAGAPLPYHDWHWSTTNTRGLAGGLVAPCPVALDAEWLKRPRLGAVRSYFDPRELALVAGFGAPAALVLWTAKEVVLKLTGVGLAGLPDCELISAEAPHALVVGFRGRRQRVHSMVAHEHVLAFACEADSPCFELEELEEVLA